MFSICLFTVEALTPIPAAISLLLVPWATSWRCCGTFLFVAPHVEILDAPSEAEAS